MVRSTPVPVYSQAYSCKHLCCREGLDKPPKEAQKPAASGTSSRPKVLRIGEAGPRAATGFMKKAFAESSQSMLKLTAKNGFDVVDLAGDGPGERSAGQTKLSTAVSSNKNPAQHPARRPPMPNTGAEASVVSSTSILHAPTLTSLSRVDTQRGVSRKNPDEGRQADKVLVPKSTSDYDDSFWEADEELFGITDVLAQVGQIDEFGSVYPNLNTNESYRTQQMIEAPPYDASVPASATHKSPITSHSVPTTPVPIVTLEELDKSFFLSSEAGNETEIVGSKLENPLGKRKLESQSGSPAPLGLCSLGFLANNDPGIASLGVEEEGDNRHPKRQRTQQVSTDDAPVEQPMHATGSSTSGDDVPLPEAGVSIDPDLLAEFCDIVDFS